MKRKVLVLAAFVVLVSIAWAVNYTKFDYVEVRQNLLVDGTITPTAVTIPATNTTVLTASSVSLTSPTTTFSITGKNYITLTSDANQTGVRPTGGTTGQVVTIRSGSGSNTMRFDDNATTLSLGGNITLTEGQDDVLSLVVTGSGTYARLFSSDN